MKVEYILPGFLFSLDNRTKRLSFLSKNISKEHNKAQTSQVKERVYPNEYLRNTFLDYVFGVRFWMRISTLHSIPSLHYMSIVPSLALSREFLVLRVAISIQSKINCRQLKIVKFYHPFLVLRAGY